MEGRRARCNSRSWRQKRCGRGKGLLHAPGEPPTPPQALCQARVRRQERSFPVPGSVCCSPLAGMGRPWSRRPKRAIIRGVRLGKGACAASARACSGSGQWHRVRDGGQMMRTLCLLLVMQRGHVATTHGYGYYLRKPVVDLYILSDKLCVTMFGIRPMCGRSCHGHELRG